MPHYDRFRGRFTDALARAVTVTFEEEYPEGETYDGGVEAVPLGGEPLTEVAGRDADEIQVMQPRTLRVRLAAQAQQVRQALYASERAWRLRVEVDAGAGVQLDFLGHVVRSDNERTIDLRPESYELQATCGLARLKSVPFSTLDLADARRRTVAWWISYCLEAARIPLPLATASEWYAHGMMPDRDPLDGEFVAPTLYGLPPAYGQGGVRPSGDWTMWEVVEDLLKGKGLFLCQEGGEWRAFQRALFRQAAFDTWVYPVGWHREDHAPAQGAHPAQHVIERPISYRNAGSRARALAQYKGVDVAYEHGVIESLTQNPDFELSRPSLYADEEVEGWTYEEGHYEDDGGFAYIVGGGMHMLNQGVGQERVSGLGMPVYAYDDAQTVRSQLIDEATSKSVYVESTGDIHLALEISAALFADREAAPYFYNFGAYLEVKLITEDADGNDVPYWLDYARVDENGDLVTSNQAAWSTGASLVSLPIPLDGSDTFNIFSHPLPADGHLEVTLFGALDPKTAEINPEHRIGLAMIWDRVRVVPLRPFQKEPGATTRMRTVLDLSAPERDLFETTVAHGTGPTSTHESATWRFATYSRVQLFGEFPGGGGSQPETETSGRPMLGDWKLGAYADGEQPSGISAGQLLSRELLKQLWPQRQEIDATYNRFAEPGLTRAFVELDEGGQARVYLPARIRRSYKRCTAEVLAREVAYAEVLFDYLENQEGGRGSGGGGGGRGSGGATILQELSRGSLMVSKLGAFAKTAEQLPLDPTTSTLISSIPVTAPLSAEAALVAGAEVTVAGQRGGLFVFTLSADVADGDTSLTIEEVDMGEEVLPSESGVHLGALDVLREQTRFRTAAAAELAERWTKAEADARYALKGEGGSGGGVAASTVGRSLLLIGGAAGILSGYAIETGLAESTPDGGGDPGGDGGGDGDPGGDGGDGGGGDPPAPPDALAMTAQPQDAQGPADVTLSLNRSTGQSGTYYFAATGGAVGTSTDAANGFALTTLFDPGTYTLYAEWTDPDGTTTTSPQITFTLD